MGLTGIWLRGLTLDMAGKHTHKVKPSNREEALANDCQACTDKVLRFRSANADYDKNRRGKVDAATLKDRRAQAFERLGE